MTKRLTICLLAAAALSGCGGSAIDSKSPANSTAANSAVVENTGQNTPDANLSELANANVNAVNNAPVRRAPRKPKIEDPELVPEDSELTIDKNSFGDLVETRVFKNHDMVAKVERTKSGDKGSPSVKVFLKNGKVYDLPAGKLKNVLMESPEDIVKAVGADSITTNRAVTDAKTSSGTANAAAPAGAPSPPKHR